MDAKQAINFAQFWSETHLSDSRHNYTTVWCTQLQTFHRSLLLHPQARRIRRHYTPVKGAHGGAFGWGTKNSISDSFFGIFHWRIPADLWPWVGSACNRNETRNISWGVKAAGATADFTTSTCRLSGNLEVSQLLWALGACSGVALPLHSCETFISSTSQNTSQKTAIFKFVTVTIHNISKCNICYKYITTL